MYTEFTFTPTVSSEYAVYLSKDGMEVIVMHYITNMALAWYNYV